MLPAAPPLPGEGSEGLHPDDLRGRPVDDGTSRVLLFHNGRDALRDIRTPGDVRAVEAALYDRLRVLLPVLPEDTRLVGSLAGGRKTMSASLQTAFSLIARPDDRLVHVLVHSALERWATNPASNYYFPCPLPEGREPIAPEQQTFLVNVPFPLVSTFIHGSSLAETLRDKPYDEVWTALREDLARIGDDLHAELRGDELHGYHYLIKGAGRTHDDYKLTARPAALLAAVLAFPDGATYDELAEWMTARGLLARKGGEPYNLDTSEGLDDARSSLRRIASRLKKDLPQGQSSKLNPFLPVTEGRSGVRLIVRNARLVDNQAEFERIESAR